MVRGLDHRIALKQGTQLVFSNQHGERSIYYIDREISRGGSNILYDAYRLSANDVKIRYRIKEFYPFSMEIERDKNQQLIVKESDLLDYQADKNKVVIDFKVTNSLFYSGSNYSRLVNQVDLFESNNTVYTVCSYTSEKTLATYRPATLKECVHLVKLCAYSISKIHDQGFLYLDLKPENILLVDGLSRQVLLCDFDSMVSLNPMTNKIGNKDNVRLSYSKGFAPIEQEMGQISRLGIHSDIFGIGALLFYLLFGRTPNAFECQIDAIFDEQSIKYSMDWCDSRLFDELTNFLCHTIAIYFADRYQSMGPVLEKLELIEKYADTEEPRIISSYIVEPKHMFGRHKELEQLWQLLHESDRNCVNVYGLGGIGKSKFVRHYLCHNRNDYTTILYLRYQDNLNATIADETQVTINTLNDITDDVYSSKLDRKKRMLRKLLAEQNSLVVIDDFDGTVNDLEWLFHTKTNLVVISRACINSTVFSNLHIDAIEDSKCLRLLFETNLGRKLNAEETDDFIQISDQCQRHTLLLELIGKLIANAHISIRQAADSLTMFSLDSVASEKVVYEKDEKSRKIRVSEVIQELFRFSKLTDSQKQVMASMTCISQNGININNLQLINKLKNKDDINDLIDDGWLEIFGDNVKIHRLIQETVVQTDVDLCENLAKRVSSFFTTLLQLFLSCSLKNQKSDHESDWECLITHRFPTDTFVFQSIIETALGVIRQTKRYGLIVNHINRLNLIYNLIMVLPKDRIDDLIYLANEYMLNLKPKDIDDYRHKMEIYRVLVLTASNFNLTSLCQRWELESSFTANNTNDDYCHALVWDIHASLLDTQLDGNYYAMTQSDKQIRAMLIDAIERALALSKQYIKSDCNCLYINNLLSKATILMRSGIETRFNEIPKILKECHRLIEWYLKSNCNEHLNYVLVSGWYYALEEANVQKTLMAVHQAQQIGQILINNDATYIVDVLIPCANMLVECGEANEGLKLLLNAIQRTLSHSKKTIYRNLIVQLCDYYYQTCMNCDDFQSELDQLVNLLECAFENQGDHILLKQCLDALTKPES